MKNRKIAIVNRSNIVTHEDFEIMVRACDLQLKRDVAPLWGMVPREVRAFASRSKLPRHCLPIRIVDDPKDIDDEDSLGWHFEEDDGQPFGRVFVNNILAGATTDAARRKRIRHHPLSVSVVLSHEVIEAFIDPDINLWAYDPDAGVFHSYEACDAVQTQTYVVQVPGGRVHVSNFVTPNWFDAENRGGARFVATIVTT